MIQIEGARVVVVGMARSGVAAVELLVEKGARVTAVDQNPTTNERLTALGIAIQPQTASSFLNADLIILSPGVPADAEPVVEARKRGIEVVGDLELASWFLQGPIAGITGSNGKTTTTAMTGHILQHSGIAAQVGGNIGVPPASMVAASRPNQWNVLELSSFQLETIKTFRAKIGSALNVTPDHLDRHYTLANYAESKARLFDNQQPSDSRVLNADDPLTRSYDTRGRGTTMWFSSTREVSPGAWLDPSGRILLNGAPLMDARDIPLRGLHNIENTMAAATIAHLAGATHDQIRAAVTTFPGVEHRLEFVRDLNGVAWYNDSKATNVDATLKALAAFDTPLWVILGGKDKNSDYTPLADPLKSKARRVLLIGAAAQKIEAQLPGVPAQQLGTLAQAIAEAHRSAKPGDTVLLAPACASFDQFENFEHRGREFKRLVGALEGGSPDPRRVPQPALPPQEHPMAKLRTDWILFLTIVAMVGFGMVMLYSASSAVAELRYNVPPYYFVFRQLLWAVVSFLALMYFKRMDYHKLNTSAWAFSALGIVLALLVLVFFMDPRAHRWFRLPGVGSLQPSEFAKPALILFLAYFVSRHRKKINDRRTLYQIFLAVAMLGVLVVAADLGTALVPVLTALVVLWVAGLERGYMLRVAMVGVALIAVAVFSKPYRLGRVIAYVDPKYELADKIPPHGWIRNYVQSSTTIRDTRYQPYQAKLAVGSGGVLGVGLMQGKQKLMFLPDAHTDFIYATVGEELGLWGSSAVLLGFVVILWRGARLFVLARDDFGKYLALGVTVSIVFQAFINISVVLDMAPTKGFPLPMISFGGSSLLSTLVSLGMLLSVSDNEG